jgi:phospholipase/carboxylesterase
MNTRRSKSLVTRVALALTASYALSCESAPTANPNPLATATPAPTLQALPLEYKEIMTGHAAANDPAPLIVALHGVGDTPVSFAEIFDGFAAPARILVPDSGVHFGDGYQWFPPSIRPRSTDGPELAAMATRVAAFVEAAARRRPTLGKPILVGFSQGAAVTFTVAALHPDSIGTAIPLAGWLPEAFWPKTRPAVAPEVFASQGTLDDHIPLERGHSAVTALTNQGYVVHWQEFDGVRHEIPDIVRAALYATLTARCELERRRVNP